MSEDIYPRLVSSATTRRKGWEIIGDTAAGMWQVGKRRVLYSGVLRHYTSAPSSGKKNLNSATYSVLFFLRVVHCLSHFSEQ